MEEDPKTLEEIEKVERMAKRNRELHHRSLIVDELIRENIYSNKRPHIHPAGRIGSTTEL